MSKIGKLERRYLFRNHHIGYPLYFLILILHCEIQRVSSQRLVQHQVEQFANSSVRGTGINPNPRWMMHIYVSKLQYRTRWRTESQKVFVCKFTRTQALFQTFPGLSEMRRFDFLYPADPSCVNMITYIYIYTYVYIYIYIRVYNEICMHMYHVY